MLSVNNRKLGANGELGVEDLVLQLINHWKIEKVSSRITVQYQPSVMSQVMIQLETRFCVQHHSKGRHQLYQMDDSKEVS